VKISPISVISVPFFMAKSMTNSDPKCTVLIVDDTLENIQVLSNILYQKGINILIVQSGREALDIVVRKPPDLVLLDIIMPEMDGFEVCERLKENPVTKNIPIIFLTARTQPDDIVKGFELGAVDYVTRPFNTVELLSRVLTHLELKRSQDLITAQNQQLAGQNRQLEEQNRKLQELYAFKEKYFSDTLRERVKELNCLYSISHLVEKSGISLPQILQETVELIPPAWQYPEITCARITLEDQEFGTENFRETPWSQSGDIIVHDKAVGTLEVCYLKEKPESAEGPFLNEERNLLNAIAERAGRIIEHKQAEEALRTSEQQYHLLVENVADGIGIIQEGTLVFVNESLASMLGFTADHLVGRSPVDLFHKDYQAQFRKMYQQLKQGSPDQQSWPVLQCVASGDNREIWIEGRHSVITWEGKPAFLVNMRDITKRKLREMAIEEEREHLQRENIKLRAAMKDRYRFDDIIGKSQVMHEVYELILKAAASKKDVLICGKSGTGKELIARTIHRLSERQGNTFVPVNCGAIPESLFEREFFGHRKGAFTGADRDKQGFFGAAHEGTLFLDEVGELSLAMQVKLLRAIETGEYTPIGDSKPKTTDVRIIAATHRNLTEQLEKGMMREDFFYRIHVVVITVPPLKDRKEDIPLLVDYFLKQYSESKTPPDLPGRVLEALYNHDWPGNIRQLKNALYRYLTVGRLDFIEPPGIGPVGSDDVPDRELAQQELRLHEAVEQLEKRLIVRTLDQHHWHRTNAATTLGIPRRSLLRKMKKYGLT